MKRVLAIALAVLTVPAAVAWALPTVEELDLLVADIRADEAECEQAREYADQVTRENTRPLFRALLIPITEAETLAEARSLGAHALEVLAAPGGGASKVIHTVNRQMGSTCIQGIRSAASRVEALAD